MKPLSDAELTNVLAQWKAPEPPPGLALGVWARMDARPPSWMDRAWAFRLAVGMTLALWVFAVWIAPQTSPPSAADSLTAALVRAGSAR